jgi:hypothetical protein
LKIGTIGIVAWLEKKPTGTIMLLRYLTLLLPVTLMLSTCTLFESRGKPIKNDYALRLDGDDDYVDLGSIGPEHPLMLAGSPFTIAAWFNQEAGGDPYQRLIDKSDEIMGHNGWGLGANPSSGHIWFFVHNGSTGGNFLSSRSGYSLGRWHHVVAVARREKHEIWIDGERDQGCWYETGSHALPAAAMTTARIGTWNHADAREWKGRIAEIAVWNVDLSEGAIRAVYRSHGRSDLREDWAAYRSAVALVGYWRMGDGPENGRGSIVYDLSPTAATGSQMPGDASHGGPVFELSDLP